MILYILNLFDLVSTLIALSHGAAEMNPLMDFCFSIHPALFTLVKMSALPLFLWLERKSKIYPYVVGAYAATVWWNIVNIAAILAA